MSAICTKQGTNCIHEGDQHAMFSASLCSTYKFLQADSAGDLHHALATCIIRRYDTAYHEVVMVLCHEKLYVFSVADTCCIQQPNAWAKYTFSSDEG